MAFGPRYSKAGGKCVYPGLRICRVQMALRGPVQCCSELLTNLMVKSKPWASKDGFCSFGCPSLSIGLDRNTSESCVTLGKFARHLPHGWV